MANELARWLVRFISEFQSKGPSVTSHYKVCRGTGQTLKHCLLLSTPGKPVADLAGDGRGGRVRGRSRLRVQQNQNGVDDDLLNYYSTFFLLCV